MEYYTTVKRNVPLIHTIRWIISRVLSERSTGLAKEDKRQTDRQTCSKSHSGKYHKNNKAREEDRSTKGKLASSNKVVGRDLFEVTYEQRAEGHEGVGPCNMGEELGSYRKCMRRHWKVLWGKVINRISI